MTEELQTQQQPQAAPMQPQPKPRLGPQDYRNSELVTKLMAANPPYLYSPAVGPHNFFFSEMLRSLVANKRNESLRNATEQLHHHHHQQQQQQQQQQHHPQQQPQQPVQHSNHLTNHLALQAPSSRRPRKRSWSQHRYYPEASKDGKDTEDRRPAQPEKPLELTNKLSAFSRNITSTSQKYSEGLEPSEAFKAPTFHDRKSDDSKPPTAAGVSDKDPINNSTLIQEPSTASMPPSDLILPPPPPVWYPPLYPPYGIDPLHFFIDLRVSGHIYDRKKDSNSSNSSEDSVLTVKREHSKLIGTGNDRQGSAFSVPKPRETALGNKTNPINLTAPQEDGDGVAGEMGYGAKEPTEQQTATMGSLFLGDVTDHKTIDAIKSTNYVLQNLPRIYGDLNGNHKIADRCLTDDETNGNLSDEHEQDSKSVGSADDLIGEENKYKDVDLNVISDEESIAVDEN
uniref:Uncharacterized protein n=1 Tax=Anopheles funestus TaxID=62324 RepID=A0A182RSG0_ANOFN